MELNPKFRRWFVEVLVALSLVLLFIWIRQISLTLFRSFADLFSIVVAFSIFVLGWNARRFTQNGYLPFLGIAFLAIAAIDTAHLLVSVRADLLSLEAASQAERLWISARMAHASAMLLTPFFFRRRANLLLVILAFLIITVANFVYVFRAGVFPLEHIQVLRTIQMGQTANFAGLLLFVLAGLHFFLRRQNLEPDFYRYSLMSILFAALAQVDSILAGYTFYSGIFFVDRMILMLSFFLIFKAVIETGYRKPYDFLFQDLKEQRDLLQDIIDINPGGLAVIAGSRQIFQMANQTYRELVPRQDLDPIGRTFGEVWSDIEEGSFDKAELAERQQLIRQVMESGRHVYTEGYHLERPDGSQQYLNIHIRPTTWRGEPAVLSSLWDITSLKIAQEQAHQAAQDASQRAAELEALMDAVPAGVFVALDSECRQVIGNRAAYKLFRLPDDLDLSALAHRDPSRVFRLSEDGEEIPETELPLQRVARTGQALLDFGQEIVFQDGTKAHLFGNIQPLFGEDGQPNGAIAAFVDITERVEVEKALRESEDRFRSLIESMDDLVFTLDQDQRCTALYGKLLYRHAASAEEFLGKRIDEIVDESIAANHIDANQRVLQGEHVIFESAIPWKGERIVLQLNMSPMRDERGRVTGVVGVSRDITPLKEAEANLERYAAQLERSNRELEQFAYVASHDLQEPLRKIRFFGEQLKDKKAGRSGENESDYIDRMLSASRRMQDMIDDLLAYSRITTKAQPFVPVDLKQVAEEVVCDLETRIEQVRGIVKIADLPVIDADPLQMHRLLLNLIGNALKYHRPDVQPQINVFSELDDRQGQVRLLVEDNGIGFAEEHLERIFRPFERLHGRSEYEGSGMGLAICQKIAERHGGTITARSQPGKGSTFVVTLTRKQK